MNTNPDSSSRFRKSGLTRSLTTTAACAAGAAALLTTEAAIILQDPVGASVDLTDPSGQFQNVFIPGGEGSGLQLYSEYDAKSGFQRSGVKALISLVAVDPSGLKQLGSGVSVDASLSFDVSGGIANPDVSGWVARGNSGFFGFTFNPSGSLPLYGWGELVRSATGTDMVTFTRYAYQDSGSAILTGDTGAAVPEPEDYALVAGAGLLTVAGYRRWRQRG